MKKFTHWQHILCFLGIRHVETLKYFYGGGIMGSHWYHECEICGYHVRSGY